MQTCNMDERTNEEKLRDCISELEQQNEALLAQVEEIADDMTCCDSDAEAHRIKEWADGLRAIVRKYQPTE